MKYYIGNTISSLQNYLEHLLLPEPVYSVRVISVFMLDGQLNIDCKQYVKIYNNLIVIIDYKMQLFIIY